MTQVFAMLVLLSLILLLIGLVKPGLLKQDSRKKVLYIFGGALVVFMILMGISEPKKTETVAENNQSAKTTVVTTQTDQQKFEVNLNSIVSGFTGSTKVSYKGIEWDSENDSSRPKGAVMLTVSVNASDFYNKDTFLKDTGKLSAQIMQASYLSYIAPYDVLVQFYGDTTDRYGNKQNKPIVIYAIDKTTFGKINWQNFDTSTFCDFLKQQEQIDGIEAGSACNVLVNIQ